MSVSSENHKVDRLIGMITSLASLDFSKRIDDWSGNGDPLDTMAIGLNMLSEELEANVVERARLVANKLELEEANLKMNEFNYALNSSSIVVITDLSGTITYVNDKFCKISKYSKEELLGENQRIVNSGYHPTEFWVNMWRTIVKGKIWTDEIKNKAKDGSIYWVNTTIVPFLNKLGKPYKFMAIRSDITERKLLDQQILNSILSTQEQDREVFSEDLHEGIAQSLAALMMQVGVIELKVKDSADKQLQESIDFIKSYIQESIENTRVMATSLMPRMMMKYGLEPSLRSYISSIQKEGIRFIQFTANIDLQIGKDIEITLYRIIVGVINKVNENEVNSIVISISNTPSYGLVVSVAVKCCKENVNACSIGELDFTIDKKRIEILGGYYRLQKQLGSLKMQIKFV